MKSNSNLFKDRNYLPLAQPSVGGNLLRPTTPNTESTNNKLLRAKMVRDGFDIRDGVVERVLKKVGDLVVIKD